MVDVLTEIEQVGLLCASLVAAGMLVIYKIMQHVFATRGLELECDLSLSSGDGPRTPGERSTIVASDSAGGTTSASIELIRARPSETS